ncbi:MAG: hypothetical protein KJ064_21610 [Anaerolineae bacterium]|nr:hypothetical protein [Anaerolineae bacterium]
MQDEIAYLKGEPRPPTLLDRPAEKAIFKGVVSLVAVPVAFVLGFYWLVSGLRQRV